MPEVQIILGGDVGEHNRDLKATAERIKRGQGYRDLSTVCVIPTRGLIMAKVVERWWALLPPMNQAFVRIFVQGMEVGDAYNAAVEMILQQLPDFKYMLTLEEDNTPPPDGLLKLYESMEEFSVVGGLYFTKGEGGMPMIYGDPTGILNFMPQVPLVDQVQEANGLGMGFTLFDMRLFKDERIERPWFRTINEWDPQKGVSAGTQDLQFFGKIRKLGYRVASDNRVRVGHVDTQTGQIW